MITENTATQKTVARINNVDIVIFENGEKLVPVKPICEALGIDYPSQFSKLKTDPILMSTVVLSPMVGADGKDREMFCLPLKYVFGWLFRIDSRNVKEESRDSVLQYQRMCYDVLYDYFSSYAEFVEQKQHAIEEQLKLVADAKFKFRNAKSVLDDADKRLNVLRKLTFDNYDADKRQLKLQFDEEEEGGQQ